MHDAQLMDVLHAGRDVLEAEQHTALHPRPGVSRPVAAAVLADDCRLLCVAGRIRNSVRSHSTDAL
jgi:alpha-D-ribose 1-methylphosphonate 5-triphosphate diphosphatase PhnM